MTDDEAKQEIASGAEFEKELEALLTVYAPKRYTAAERREMAEAALEAVAAVSLKIELIRTLGEL